MFDGRGSETYWYFGYIWFACQRARSEGRSGTIAANFISLIVG